MTFTSVLPSASMTSHAFPIQCVAGLGTPIASALRDPTSANIASLLALQNPVTFLEYDVECDVEYWLILMDQLSPPAYLSFVLLF